MTRLRNDAQPQNGHPGPTTSEIRWKLLALPDQRNRMRNGGKTQLESLNPGNARHPQQQ